MARLWASYSKADVFVSCETYQVYIYQIRWDKNHFFLLQTCFNLSSSQDSAGRNLTDYPQLSCIRCNLQIFLLMCTPPVWHRASHASDISGSPPTCSSLWEGDERPSMLSCGAWLTLPLPLLCHYKGLGVSTCNVCGSVAEWLGLWTCDQQVASSNPGLSAVECNPGQVVNTHVPLSPSSIIWYQPMGGDALRLGR